MEIYEYFSALVLYVFQCKLNSYMYELKIITMHNYFAECLISPKIQCARDFKMRLLCDIFISGL